MSRFSITKMLSLLLFLSIISCKEKEVKEEKQQPNIIVIYADDLGFGDVSAYGSTVLQTPNIDRIANEGIKFMNGYAASPTCTPSRYALLSGNYPFKKGNARVLPGNAPLIFDTSKQTLPSMLREAGYTTGVVGKWHLGLGDENMDWNSDIKPGPLEIGFDESFIMASTNDRVPSVYVRDHRVVGLDPNDPIEVSYTKNFEGEPTGKENPELLKIHPSHGHDMSIHNGISRIGYMRGGKSALFTDEDMSDDFLRESKAFIDRNKEKPFFLFYSLHQPHVPRVPHPRFVGKTTLGPRGDVIVEADWAVGQLLDYLDELKLTENTIVIFSSDNGPVLDDGYQTDAVEKNGEHTPTGGLRGGKYSLFDAGTHVPFMVMWKGTIEPGISDALVSQMDLTASFAAFTGQKNTTDDSQNVIDALLGKSEKGRESLILGRNNGVSIRKGDWILIPPHKGPKSTGKFTNIETGRDTIYQLYNVKDDMGQQVNLAEKFPEKVEELKAEMEKVK
ncbi:arylsulfatase [Aureibaculum sp. 2210JD6-5]|uniref:sulfatase family protein n=1 Tax=Aureibaculum sp. 2210JD6-5 TaxID=3103957 RepID=UPI002AAC8E97|nr:arylsulfatase [Aureibaculum sp. 2210JD6-5]MDY7394298.1 arylsulfatase [Aureibaculum sp. 2210JD6-5]